MAQLTIPYFLEKAFNNGFVYVVDENIKYEFYVFDIGILNVNDGIIVACDPFLHNKHLPFTTQFPVGRFPVQLAIATTNNEEKVSFARIKFSDNNPVKWQLAVCDQQHIEELREGEIFGYAVDSGSGAYMDTSGAKELKHYLSVKASSIHMLLAEMEKNHRSTWDWLMWEKNDCNAALFTAGYGEGYYATYIGYDDAGNICRLVTDFEVIE